MHISDAQSKHELRLLPRPTTQPERRGIVHCRGLSLARDEF